MDSQLFDRFAAIFLAVALAAGAAACSSPDDASGSSDAGADADASADADPGFRVELGRSGADGDFVAYAEPSDTIELVAGFQGGYHLEPEVALDGLERDRFITMLEWSVRDAETGQQLNQASDFRFDETEWWEQGGLLVHHSYPVILDIAGPEEVDDRQVELEVVVEVEGVGQTTATSTVTIDASAAVLICYGAPPPEGLGEPCSGDGECTDYLRCTDSVCAVPPALGGPSTPSNTTQVTIARDGTTLWNTSAEVAASDLQRERGLAGRPCIDYGWSMLFIHPQAETVTYTVDDAMQFGIDMAFANAAGEIVAIESDVQPHPGASFTYPDVQLVLETQSGEFEDRGIQVGDTILRSR